MRLTALLACLLARRACRRRAPGSADALARRRPSAAPPRPRQSRSAPLFQFKVQNAAKSRGGYYLDSEKDFHSAANLGVAIKASAMPGLTKKYGDDLKSALVGKTIKLIGQVRRVPVGKDGGATATQVEVTHAGQILSVS